MDYCEELPWIKSVGRIEVKRARVQNLLHSARPETSVFRKGHYKNRLNIQFQKFNSISCSLEVSNLIAKYFTPLVISLLRSRRWIKINKISQS